MKEGPIVNPFEMHEQAQVLGQQGRYAEAIELATKAVRSMREQVAADDPNLAVALTNLGFYYAATKQWREALACYTEGLALRIRREGLDSPGCAKTTFHVARCHEALGEIDRAVEQYRRCIEVFDAHPDAGPVFHVNAIRGLAWLLAEAGRAQEAVPVLRKGVRLLAGQVRGGNRQALPTLRELCDACLAERDLDALALALAETLGEAAAWSYLDGIARELVERRRPRETATPTVPDDEEWLRDQRAAMQAVRQDDQSAPIAAQHAYETAKRKFGPRSLAAALSSNLIAVSYQNLGRMEEALPWLMECLEATRASAPSGEPMYAAIVRDTANALSQAKRFGEAGTLLQEVIELRRAQQPVDNSALALAIHDLAAARAGAGAAVEAEAGYAEAQSVLAPDDRLREALEIRRRAMTAVVVSHAEMRPEHKKRLFELANRRRTQPAAEVLKEAETLQAETREYLDERAHDNMLLLTALGSIRLDLGQMPEAAAVLERARQIARQYHAGTGAAYPSDSLARAYVAMGRYREAEPLFAEAVDFLGKLFGATDTRTLNTVNAQGMTLFQCGRYGEAENLLLMSCNALRELGTAGSDLALAIGNLAVLYRHMGRYKEAEPLYDESTQLVRKAFGEDSEEYAKVLNNSALFCDEVGLDEKAYDLYQKALAIVDRIGTYPNPERARILNNLGMHLTEAGDNKRAEEMLLEACEIRRAAIGEVHHDYLTSLHNLGIAQHSLGRDAEARATLTRTLELKQRAVGPDHVSCAFTMNSLAVVCDALGESERARSLFEQSTAARRRALGARHPATARSLGMEAQFHWSHGDVDSARPRFREALEIYRYLVADLFPGMTESERAHYWDHIRELFELFTAFALDTYGKHGEMAGDLYEVQLFARALVLDSVVAARRAIGASEDPGVRPVYERWLGKKRELASQMTVRGRARADGSAAESLDKEIEALEKELVQRRRTFARAAALRNSTWRDVQRKLAPGEAAIEIVRGPGSHPSSTGSVYAALVLRPDTVDGPRLVEIGGADALELAGLERYRETITTTSKASYVDYWAPIAQELHGVTRAYVSPDGVYGLIDLNALYDGEHFLLDTLDLRIVTSTRELLGEECAAASERTAVLFGRPAYDRPPAEAVGPGIAGPGAAATRGEVLRFTDLPGTEIEVREIESVLRDQGWNVDVLLQEQACRAALRRIRSPRVLHLATHGFFLGPHETHYRRPGSGMIVLIDEEEPEDQPGYAEFVGALQESGYRKESELVQTQVSDRFGFRHNPLFRSGLALAGAAAGLESDDGLFTAYEATSLDLGETQLVTLSACESGLGVARAGEGIVGFGRAFRAAGARFLLMALRPVDDTIARELMQAFYTAWLASGDLRGAFRQSQRQLRSRYRQPMLWAGFVLVGR